MIGSVHRLIGNCNNSVILLNSIVDDRIKKLKK